jgi:hypothetical protein
MVNHLDAFGLVAGEVNYGRPGKAAFNLHKPTALAPHR